MDNDFPTDWIVFSPDLSNDMAYFNGILLGQNYCNESSNS